MPTTRSLEQHQLDLQNVIATDERQDSNGTAILVCLFICSTLHTLIFSLGLNIDGGGADSTAVTSTQKEIEQNKHNEELPLLAATVSAPPKKKASALRVYACSNTSTLFWPIFCIANSNGMLRSHFVSM